MMRSVVIALGIAAAVALPAGAQRVAAEIALVEAAAPEGAVVLGEVRAEIHQTSLFAKTPARDLADRELRAQAAKLGADAVVDIRYENSSPMLSKKGFRAAGKAVRFAPVAVAAPVVPAQPDESERVIVADARLPERPQAPVPEPVINAPVIREPAPEPAAATPTPVAPPAPAAPPVAIAPPVVQQAPAVAAAVPAAPRVTPEALIVLTEEDLVGRAYERLGEVKAEARQTSLFPKKPARATMDEQLRAKAAALGADAVILIRYDSYSPLTSKKGASATGIAVKYR